jgi:hypothetical protein
VDGGGALGQADYIGVYAVAELVRRGNTRVDVEKLDSTDTMDPAVTGGYIFRKDHGESEFSALGQDFQWVYPNSENMATPARRAQRDYLVGFVEDFLQAAGSTDHTHPMTGEHYSAFIDVESFIDHSLLALLTKNVDALRLSAYMSKERNGPIVAGPVWDFDRSMGTPYDGRATEADNWTVQDSTHPLEWQYYGDLYSDPEYESAYWRRWQALRCANWTSTGLLALVDEMANEVRPAAERHFDRYPDLAPRGGFDREIEILRDWIAERLSWVDEQAPNVSP